MLGINLFFDTLNAISIKIPMYVIVQSQLYDFNKLIELNKFLSNVCIIWVNIQHNTTV
jgi:hypothetical protein